MCFLKPTVLESLLGTPGPLAKPSTRNSHVNDYRDDGDEVDEDADDHRHV